MYDVLSDRTFMGECCMACAHDEGQMMLRTEMPEIVARLSWTYDLSVFRKLYVFFPFLLTCCLYPFPNFPPTLLLRGRPLGS